MRGYGFDASCFERLFQLAPDSHLGALWLAHLLRMKEVHDKIVEYLLRTVNARNAHAYLPTAVTLGFVKVRDTLVQLAAEAIKCIPVETLCLLPPHARTHCNENVEIAREII